MALKELKDVQLKQRAVACSFSCLKHIILHVESRERKMYQIILASGKVTFLL